MTPSGKQIRAARSLAGWERTDLAKHTGLSTVTIRYIENETSAAKKETMERIIAAFRNVGIEFIENDGVRRLPIGIEIFEGRDRFEEFINFMYEYLERHGGDVCIYIQDEGLLGRTRKNIAAHRERMAALVNSGKITGRILAAKGVEHSDWAEIRRIPLIPDMAQVSFMTFGDNLALISFDHKTPPYVVLHRSGPFAFVYKNSFDAAWEKGKPTK